MAFRSITTTHLSCRFPICETSATLHFATAAPPGGVPTGQRLARAGRRPGEWRAALQPGGLLREPRVASLGLSNGQRLRCKNGELGMKLP